MHSWFTSAAAVRLLQECFEPGSTGLVMYSNLQPLLSLQPMCDVPQLPDGSAMSRNVAGRQTSPPSF